MTKIASPKSAAWARSILTERDCEGIFTASEVAALVAAIDAGEAAQSAVSEVIDSCRNAPRLRKAAAPQGQAFPEVPEGRYALPHEDGTKFYKVDRPESGRWEGFTFLNALGSDNEYPIRNGAEKRRILAAIAEDPHAALVRYGHEVGACGVCGRTLTDEASREAGIGPVCAGRL